MLFGLKDLDSILNCMVKTKEYGFKALQELASAVNPNIVMTDVINVIAMLTKLEDDGYIVNFHKEIDPRSGDFFIKPSYKITFNGILFNQSGGYVGEDKRSKEHETRIKSLERESRDRTRNAEVLAAFVAVFASVTCAHDLLDSMHLYKKTPIPLVWALLYIILGLVAGFAISALLRRKSEHKKLSKQ